MRRRGFTIIEILIALAVLVYAFMAFLQVYATAAQQEVQSQNRALAAVLGQSYLDQFEAHRYGAPPLDLWGLGGPGQKESQWMECSGPTIFVEGRPVEADFHAKIFLKTGGLTQAQSGAYDIVTLVISWSEKGARSQVDYGDYTKVFYQQDNQHLVIQYPVQQ